MDKQLWLAVLVPVLVTISGFVQNGIRLTAIEGRLTRIEAELVQIREKVWSFSRDLGRHDKAIEVLEAKVK